MERSPQRVVSFATAAVAELRNTTQFLAQRLDKKDPFINTLGPLLSAVGTCLKDLEQTGCARGSNVEKRLFKLLAAMETLIRATAQWPGALKPPPGHPFKPGNYPFLEDLVKGSQRTARSNMMRLAKSTHERAPQQRKKFCDSFRAFANIGGGSRGPSLSDLIVASTKPVWYDDYAASLRLLHTTLCNCSPQVESCGGSFMTNIALTHAQSSERRQDNIPFDFFFLHRHADSRSEMWKEARISVFLQGDETRSPKVRFSSEKKSSEKTSSEETPSKKISSEEFCQLVRRRERGRLLFNAANDELLYDGVELDPEQLKMLFMLNASSVSLSTILEKDKLHNNLHLKLLLSYLLAKAIWQFYDSAWMAPSWTKQSIHFMRQRSNDSFNTREVITLMHKPYFATGLRSQPKTSRSGPQTGLSEKQELMQRFPSATHLHPKILALGIMLLEIELGGEGIESYRLDEAQKDDDPIENDDHFTACRIIYSKMWEKRAVQQTVKEIIELCLKPDKGKFGTEEALVHNNLYTYVVAPLGSLFRQASSRGTDPESCIPDPISFKSTDFPPETFSVSHLQPSTPDGISPAQFMESKSMPHPTPAASLLKPTVPIRSRHEAETDISSSDDGELLGDEDSINTILDRRKHTDRWFRNFQKLLVDHNLLGRPHDKRIKVAILDSGINVNHPDFSDEDRDRIKEKITFINSDVDVDETGHGTHVAAVILRLTKNVDLYIGKITNKPTVYQREKIAHALKVARTEWDVDMINLSFGFDSVWSPDTIGDEIQQCLNHGIMVFSSASNDGGEGSRTYPAKYTGVVCAHSATWLGNKAERNPGLEKDQPNFSFVGEHVRPVWPAKMSKDDDRMKYASGTSYASPVAVSVAAFMIGYIRREMPKYQWVIEPCSPQGIIAIFKMMAHRMDGYDWVSPTRYFKHTKKAKILGDLEQYLG